MKMEQRLLLGIRLDNRNYVVALRTFIKITNKSKVALPLFAGNIVSKTLAVCLNEPV